MNLIFFYQITCQKYDKLFVVYTNKFDGKPKLLLADIPIDSKSKNNCKPNSQKINIDISALLKTSITTQTKI